MANNFHTDAGWLIVGVDGHNGIHWPFVPMWFWKINFLHPFTRGDKQKPTVLMNGVPSVTHGHEPDKLWPHLGIIPDPADLMTPLHILFGSHKCWLPRGAVEICGETSTCCVISGSMSLNASCWEYGKWPTSLVDDPGTVQTTPTVMDFLKGALTLAIDLVIDLAFEVIMKLGGAALKKLGSKFLAPLFKKGDDALKNAAKNADDVLEEGLESAGKQADEVAEESTEKAVKDAADGEASDLCNKNKCVDGHPVDLTSGDVIDEKIDFSLPGAIPCVWKRHYSSKRAPERTSLGRGGWAHSFEQWIETTDNGLLSLRDEEGRNIYFRSAGVGESVFHRMERLTLKALEQGAFEVFSHKTRLTRHYAPVDSEGKAWLRCIRDAHSNCIVLDYANGKLRRIIDTAGREIRVKLTGGGRIVRLEVWAHEILEQWVDYEYAPMGELATIKDTLGHTEHYRYDEDHRMLQATLKNGVSFYYAYDPETGRCRKTWGDDGLHTLVLEYDLEKRITRVLGNEEPRVLHWNEKGLVVREETTDGILIRSCEYDNDDYLMAEANGADEMRQFHRDDRGNLIREIDPAGNVTTWEYESDLPVLRVAPGELVTKYEHDELSLLRAVTYPSGERYSLWYDNLGHLSEVRDAEGTVVEFAYDAKHNIIGELNARGAKTNYDVDGLGRPTKRIDALGRTTEIKYDRLGKPIQVKRPDGTTTASEYDALGNPTRVTDALGQVTEMAYSGTGVLSKLVQADGRVWKFKYSPREKLRYIENPRAEKYEFAYDSAGRVVEEATFDGRTLKYAYSKAGRLSRIDYPDGTFRTFAHDPLGNVLEEQSTEGPITFERDRRGRLLGAVLNQEGRDIATTFERDRLGRVLVEVQEGRRLRYQYDVHGRRAARFMPDGQMTRYHYDRVGELLGLVHEGHETSFERDILGRETARVYRGGKLAIRSEYDSMDRIIEQRAEARLPGGGVPQALVQRMWQYDALGRVKLVEDNRWGATTYRYDAIGQLLEAQRGAHYEAFAYDAAGSIQNMLNGLEASTERAAEAEPWEIGKGNLLQKTETAAYTYDKRGRRVTKAASGQTTKYRWDVRDRLREVELPSGKHIAFTYDAFGRRLKKEVRDEYGDTRYTVDFIWDGDVLAGDFDSRRGARTFVHAPGSFVPLLQAERGQVFRYVVDQVGVPKELLNEDGRVAWSAAHSAWGKLTDEYVLAGQDGSYAVSSPFRLLGQYADEETGLCYTRFRYFDAEVGRWCSPDPVGLGGGLCLFAFPTPTTCTDPFGLDPFGDAVNALVADSNPEFRLTETNANKALSGPIGTTPKVAGSGGAGADIRFVNDAGNTVLSREVKCISGGAQGSFNKEISHAAKQVGYKGDVFVQMPHGSDAERTMERFKGARQGGGLDKYKDVTIEIVDPDGNTLYKGNVSCP